MIVVFAGPTISRDEVSGLLDSKCLPPVCHGDILRLDLSTVSAIGIIDGYFEGAPSVWHKEILYAMDQGVHVYGASSMGALRAAELHAFGMRGVGRIFEWYRDLVIEDDDEVAVLHGPGEVGYAVASEPMVNIRATLGLALQQGVIDRRQHGPLIKEAKATFYKKRNWRDLLEGKGMPGLAEWIEGNRIDLKRQDAQLMLKQMAGDQTEFAEKFQTDYHFEWTNVWQDAYQALAGSGDGVSMQLSDRDQMVFDQLRLVPADYAKYADRALLGWICSSRVQTSDGENLAAGLKSFRSKLGLNTRPELLRYMERVGLDEDGLTVLLGRQSRLRAVKNAAGDLSARIIDEMKVDGQYLELLHRAEMKRDALAKAGVTGYESGPRRAELLVWYCGQVLGIEVPDDLEGFLRDAGFKGVEEFYRLTGMEYRFSRVNVG